MNIKVFSISLFLLSFLQPLLAQKATRIAYVDMNYILANMDEYKVASEQLAQKVAQWEEEIAQKQAEIKTRQEKLEAEKPLLTPETIKDKEEEIQVLTQNLEDYKQKRFGAETGDYITQRWRLVQPIQDQVFNITQDRNKEISTLLKENLGVDYKTEKQRKQEKAKNEAQKVKNETKTEARKVRNERAR